jgi:hypothetical protein
LYLINKLFIQFTKYKIESLKLYFCFRSRKVYIIYTILFILMVLKYCIMFICLSYWCSIYSVSRSNTIISMNYIQVWSWLYVSIKKFVDT